jgi:hypothetical protein
MIRQSIIAILLVACAWALTGCGAPKVNLTPTKILTLKLDDEKKSVIVNTRIQNLITLVLPPGPEGYLWQISFHDPRFLKQMTPLKPAAGPEEGATISFLVVTGGRTRLRFVLVPANVGAGATPVNQHEVVVNTL